MKLHPQSRRMLAVLGGLAVLLLVALLVLRPRGVSLFGAALETEPPLVLSCDPITQVSAEECQGLLALFQSTRGEQWAKSSGWFRTPPPCAGWYGVACATANPVRELNLQVTKLSGTLPAEIQKLSQLERLSLQRNQVGGPLPPELGNLSRLEWLILSQNQITGTLPASLGQLAGLEQLNLGYNQLQGPLPAELGQLKALKSLYLHFNQFSGPIPPEIGNLTGLLELYLSNNQLDGDIPEQLGRLSALVTLHLENNHLSGSIPPALGKLTNLQHLALQENLFTGPLPVDLAFLHDLTTLTINSNAIQGEIPVEYTGLSNLGSDPGDMVDFGYNALFASDAGLAHKLNASDPSWLSTQTVPPGMVKAYSTENGLQVRWQAIPYSQDGGYYEVSYAESAAGPFTVAGVTRDKAAAAYRIDGLALDKTYFVRLRTYTPAHSLQKNELWSAYSEVASALYDGTPQDPGGLETGHQLFLPITTK